MRFSVFDAKLLTQTDCPASATEGTGAGTSLVGGAIRIGSPILFPERASIRTTVPSSWSVTKTESAVAVSPLGFAPS